MNVALDDGAFVEPSRDGGLVRAQGGDGDVTVLKAGPLAHARDGKASEEVVAAVREAARLQSLINATQNQIGAIEAGMFKPKRVFVG